MGKEKKLIVFNWKENPATSRAASALLGALIKALRQRGRQDAEVVVCPPFMYLPELSKKLSPGKARFSLGAQDVFWENSGAYTGEIGPAMLRGVGKNISYVIIGHSERRRYLEETDKMINKKVQAALAAGLRVILCVGEPADIRKKGVSAAQQYIKNQLKKDLQDVKDNSRLIVAYEPIWAIGTGRNADPHDVRTMAIFIKKEVCGKPPVLYGGSVSGHTVARYLCYNEINGALVGGASLHAREVGEIIKNI